MSNIQNIIKGKVNEIHSETGRSIICVREIESHRPGSILNDDTGSPIDFNFGYDGVDKDDSSIKRIKVSITYTKGEEYDINTGFLIPKGMMLISCNSTDSKWIENATYLVIDTNKMYVLGRKKYGFGLNHNIYILEKQGTETKYTDDERYIPAYQPTPNDGFILWRNIAQKGYVRESDGGRLIYNG